MNEEKELSFFKKIIISIKDFDNYSDFATLNAGTTILYIIKLMAILTLVVSVILMHTTVQKMQEVYDYIEDEISEISYKDGILQVEGKDGPIIIENENSVLDKLIIDTVDINLEKQEEYVQEIKKVTNGALVLKDKIILKTGAAEATVEYSIQELLKEYNVQEFNKEDILNYFFGNNIVSFYIMMFVILYFTLFMVYFINIIVEILLLAGLGYFTAILVKLRIKYTAMCNMASYALTLPIILDIIYIVVNAFTGLEIKYFDLMYTAIGYIYMVTAILLIKLDVIKRGRELVRIIQEQARVSEELQRKEEEERRKQEQKRKEEKQRKKEEKEKKDKESKDNDGIGSEPQGNNV